MRDDPKAIWHLSNVSNWTKEANDDVEFSVILNLTNNIQSFISQIVWLLEDKFEIKDVKLLIVVIL